MCPAITSHGTAPPGTHRRTLMKVPYKARGRGRPSEPRGRPSQSPCSPGLAPQSPGIAPGSPRSRPSEVCPGAGRPRRVLGHQFVDPADEVGLLGTALAHLAPIIQDPPQLLDTQLAQVGGAQVDLLVCGESRAALRHTRWARKPKPKRERGAGGGRNV